MGRETELTHSHHFIIPNNLNGNLLVALECVSCSHHVAEHPLPRVAIDSVAAIQLLTYTNTYSMCTCTVNKVQYMCTDVSTCTPTHGSIPLHHPSCPSSSGSQSLHQREERWMDSVKRRKVFITVIFMHMYTTVYIHVHLRSLQ